MKSDIVLLGPVRTGKSTIGKLLAERLRVPQVSLDDLRWTYYKEIGYDERLAKQIRAAGGFLALTLYWQLFDAYSVERVLAEHGHCVFDFGAGVGMSESQEQFTRVQRALASYRYRNVVLLLPTHDTDESLRILAERDTDPPADLNFDFNAHFLHHHGYTDLAKFTVYTAGHSPKATCDEILRMIEED
jgi:adenylate kinase family enzyme